MARLPRRVLSYCARTVDHWKGRIGALTVLTVVGGVLLVGPEAASAQTCINDVWQAHGNNQNVTCQANDVTLASATNINITTGGSCTNGVCSCFAGQQVTFTADFRMNLGADARYDVGFYLATDNDPNGDGAISGQCTATASLVGNTTRPNNFVNLDAAPDVCGDITGQLNTAHNPLFVTATITAPCPSTPGQQMQLPFATTWRQPGSNNVCLGTGNGRTTNDVFPGSPSKCNKGVLTLDITSVSTTLTVTKTANTASVPETGGSANYSVTVANTSAIAVTLRSLVDEPYGDITSVHGTGSLAITATTCVVGDPVGTCEIGGSIPAGGSCSCTFTATVPPGDADDTFSDEVTACADNATNPTDVCASDDAEVPYSDVETAPTLAKTASSNTCRIDTVYDVVVTNASAIDQLTLNTLVDDVYGNITQVQGAILSTTCGQSPGAGTLPALIAPAGTYSCSFTARSTSCSTTIHDTVTGGTVDDDGKAHSPTDDASVVISVTRPTP